jgi:magnesium transporter
MLKAYTCGDRRLLEIDIHAAPRQVPNTVWFDLLNPTPEELAYVVRETGLSLPEESDIVEIENSSRLSSEGEVITVTMPIVTRPPEGLRSSSCAFVLAPGRLVTIRFAQSLVFDKFPEQPHDVGADGVTCSNGETPHGAFLFVGLLEAIVDKQADALEAIRTELDTLSRKVFRREPQARGGRKGTRAPNEEAILQANLVTLGIAHDEISILRDSQLGIDRIAPYLWGTADWLPAQVIQRLKSVHADVHSLNDFNTHLTDKVQFLLDATLGLINIAQSSLMKVFTIVSLVGIPPTLIAGIYGMNFKIIPELSWTYGYLYAWVLMIMSAVLPLLWFRAKSWI